MRISTVGVLACALIMVFSTALYPATASAMQITLHIPVDLKNIPADMGPLELFKTFYDKNKTYVISTVQPFSTLCTVTGNTLSCITTITSVVNADNVYYYQIVVRDKNHMPLDKALQQRGAVLNATPVVDTGILPLF